MNSDTTINLWRANANSLIENSRRTFKLNDNPQAHIFLPCSKISLFFNWYRDHINEIDYIPKIYNDYVITIDLKDIINVSKPNLLNTFSYLSIKDYELHVDLSNAIERSTSKFSVRIRHNNNKVQIKLYDANFRYVGCIRDNGEEHSNVDTNSYYDNRQLIKCIKKHIILHKGSGDLFFDVHLIPYSDLLSVQSFMEKLQQLAGILSIAVSHYIDSYNKQYITTSNNNFESICSSVEINNEQKDYKILTKSFYDLGKLFIHDNEKEGFSKQGISPNHAFRVRGHWRHYKSGKTIFIESYIKCEEKGNLVNNIIVKPKECKNK